MQYHDYDDLLNMGVFGNYLQLTIVSNSLIIPHCSISMLDASYKLFVLNEFQSIWAHLTHISQNNEIFKSFAKMTQNCKWVPEITAQQTRPYQEKL